MRRLQVEFLPKRRIVERIVAGLSLLLATSAVVLGWRAWDLIGQVRAVRTQTADIEAQLLRAEQAAQIGLSRPTNEPPHADDARVVARTAGFPLDRVLLSIESARMEGIRVVGLDLSTGDGAVHVNLEFGDFAVLMRYVDALNAKETKPRWSLVRVQAPGGSATVTLGSASISSTWSQGDR